MNVVWFEGRMNGKIVYLSRTLVIQTRIPWNFCEDLGSQVFIHSFGFWRSKVIRLSNKFSSDADDTVLVTPVWEVELWGLRGGERTAGREDAVHGGGASGSIRVGLPFSGDSPELLPWGERQGACFFLQLGHSLCGGEVCAVLQQQERIDGLGFALTNSLLVAILLPCVPWCVLVVCDRKQIVNVHFQIYGWIQDSQKNGNESYSEITKGEGFREQASWEGAVLCFGEERALIACACFWCFWKVNAAPLLFIFDPLDGALS